MFDASKFFNILKPINT